MTKKISIALILFCLFNTIAVGVRTQLPVLDIITIVCMQIVSICMDFY